MTIFILSVCLFISAVGLAATGSPGYVLTLLLCALGIASKTHARTRTRNKPRRRQ